MRDGQDEEWIASMLRLLVSESRQRLGSRGAMLCYLLEMALMEANDLARSSVRNQDG